MGILRSEHCGRPESHAPHTGRYTHLAGTSPHLRCDGDPTSLREQVTRQVNPPPGPPSPPRHIEWTPPVDKCPEFDNALESPMTAQPVALQAQAYQLATEFISAWRKMAAEGRGDGILVDPSPGGWLQEWFLTHMVVRRANG